MTIADLIPEAGFEDDKTEYKLKIDDREDQLGWLKTIGGFANASGGKIYIGVEDKDHKLIGFTESEADQQRNRINNAINQSVYPLPDYAVTLPAYEIRGKRRYLVCISVGVSDFRPVTVKYKGIAGIYMRRNGFTNAATYEEIYEMASQSKEAMYDSFFTKTAYAETDFQQLFSFYKKYTGKEKNPSVKVMLSDGFINEKGCLSNGAVLFSDHFQGAETSIQYAVFGGITRGSEIVSLKKEAGPITEMISHMEVFVRQHMNQTIEKLSSSHRTIEAYPARALFEGIINAVAHRDYTLEGSAIQVDLFQDRLEISSPGSFYKKGDLEKTYDLTSIISQRRNRVICAVLVRCAVMEAAGTGFEKIMEEYADADSVHRPYVFSRNNQFTLVLPDLTYHKGVTTEAGDQIDFVLPPGGSKHDDAVIRFCYGHRRTAKEIAAHLGISDSAYLRNKVLGRLVESGYLISDKESRPGTYQSNPEKVVVKL